MSRSAQKSNLCHPIFQSLWGGGGGGKVTSQKKCYKLYDMCIKVMFSDPSPLKGGTGVGMGCFSKIRFAKN